MKVYISVKSDKSEVMFEAITNEDLSSAGYQNFGRQNPVTDYATGKAVEGWKKFVHFGQEGKAEVDRWAALGVKVERGLVYKSFDQCR